MQIHSKDPRAVRPAGGVADEESVDMEQRKDEQAQPESGPPSSGLIASGAELAPPQEAWGAYVDHATHCQGCRSLDVGRCEEAATLYRAYQEADAEALRQFRRGAP